MHIAFIVASAHGHINPTLAITSSLISYGYRVSYAVSDYFAPRVIASGGDAVIYHPLHLKYTLYEELRKDRLGAFPFDFDRVDRQRFTPEWRNTEYEDTLSQLARLYADDRPNLIIYDRANLAGRSLASNWDIPVIEHCPTVITPEFIDQLNQHNHTLVIVSLPEFFQTNRAALDDRFHFVGPIYTNPAIFQPWKPKVTTKMRLLVSATMGLLPQVEFFSTAVRAFENTGFHVVLSIGERIEASSLPELPENFEINRFASQQSILEHSCMFIGHGGPSSIFEALRFGVPLILAPPSQGHDRYARRVVELGLGLRLLKADLSPATLRKSALSLLNDSAILSRVKEVQKVLCQTNGAETAASLIHNYITGGFQNFKNGKSRKP